MQTGVASNPSITRLNSHWYAWIEDSPYIGELKFYLGRDKSVNQAAELARDIVISCSISTIYKEKEALSILTKPLWMMEQKLRIVGEGTYELINIWRVNTHSCTNKWKKFPKKFVQLKNPSLDLIKLAAQLSLEIRLNNELDAYNVLLALEFVKEMSKLATKQRRALNNFKGIALCSLGDLHCIAIKTKKERQELGTYYYIYLPVINSQHELLSYLSTL